MSQFRRLPSQRGASLISMLILAIIVCALALVVLRVFPSVNEYLTIRRAVTQIMKNNPSSAADVRTAFERTTEVEYSIKTITGKDLVVTPVGDGLRTSFAYNVEVPLFDPTVFLLLKYEGSAATPGVKGP